MSATHHRLTYASTRGGVTGAGFDTTLLEGLAPDRGLYMPSRWPTLSDDDMRSAATAPYADTVARTLTPFVGETVAPDRLAAMAHEAAATFAHPAIAPLVQIGPGLFVLELFHGPTLAFKDLAMQMVARLASHALDRLGERLVLVTATSGDTGAAAVRAFAGAPGVDLIVLHPHERVAPLQRRQMTTTTADNVVNVAVEGDFDDCQRLVKALLGDPAWRAGRRASSVNSINWARLAAQIPYYLSAGAALGADRRPVRFVVPTGNFGDAFAGWAAKAMGLAGVELVAAVNENDALARLINGGVYARRQARATASVSMDVQAPSNVERLVFEAFDRDPERTRAWFDTFEQTGEAAAPEALLSALRAELTAVAVREEDAAAAMRATHQATGFLACPHTGVGLAAANQIAFDAGPTVVLATAHAAKFPDVVERATGVAPHRPASLAAVADKPERFRTAPPDLQHVQAVVREALPAG